MHFTSNYPCPDCGRRHVIEEGDRLHCMDCGCVWSTDDYRYNEEKDEYEEED